MRWEYGGEIVYIITQSLVYNGTSKKEKTLKKGNENERLRIYIQ